MDSSANFRPYVRYPVYVLPPQKTFKLNYCNISANKNVVMVSTVTPAVKRKISLTDQVEKQSINPSIFK